MNLIKIPEISGKDHSVHSRLEHIHGMIIKDCKNFYYVLRLIQKNK